MEDIKKVELHVRLNGSVRIDAIKELSGQLINKAKKICKYLAIVLI